MKKLLTLFIIILFSSFVYAAPPQAEALQNLNDNTFQIVYPLFQYLRQDADMDFHFHVYNSSTGHVINQNIKCYFHLYNSSGNHILRMEDDVASNIFDYEFAVGGENFSDLGTYAYVTTCNNSVHGGFIEAAFEVTLTGNAQRENMTEIGVSIFLLFLTLLFLILPFFIKLSEREVWNNLIRKTLWWFGLAIMLFSTTIFTTLAENAGLGITSELFVFHWIFTKALYVFLILLMWDTIISSLRILKEEQRKKRMGESD